MMNRRRISIWLIAGDALALLVVSVVGFASHNSEINWRILTTFLPLMAAWVFIAPWLGVYQPEYANQVGQVWRPALAAFLAAPMAAWLRGVWLNQPVIPIFVFVLGGSAALGMFIWRLLWSSLVVKRIERYG